MCDSPSKNFGSVSSTTHLSQISGKKAHGNVNTGMMGIAARFGKTFGLAVSEGDVPKYDVLSALHVVPVVKYRRERLPANK